MEGTGRSGSMQAAAEVTRAESKSLRSQKSSELTEVNCMRPMLGGRVLQERKHRLCKLGLGHNAITYYPGDLE